MVNVGIVTDVLCNLPQEEALKHNIFMVPGYIYIDNEKFISGKEITTKQILDVIGEKTLKTAVPSPGEYFKIYEEILDNFDYIISIHSPAAQTGFITSALAGARRTKAPEKIKHVECGVTTIGLGLVAIATSIMAKKEENIDLLIQKVNDLSQKIDVIGALGSFEYLRKSGRIKLVIAGTFASLISIKPVLALHGSKIKILEKTRNRQHSLDKLLEYFNKRIDDRFEPKIIGISHLMDQEGFDDLKRTITEKFPSHQLIVTIADPMIALNTGPGLVLIGYFGKDKFD